MNENSICILASKEYRLLYWMAQHEIDTAVGPMVKFSQSELAEECESSPATVNKWIATLRKTRCIESRKRGNYRVTETGYKVIAKMKEIETLVGGDEK